jgi:hypothetical protein
MSNVVLSDERTNLGDQKKECNKKVCKTSNPEIKGRVRTEITHLKTKLLIWMVA